MFVKIENIIFRLKKQETNDNPEYDSYDRPNMPTVFIDTYEQQELIDKFDERRRLNKKTKKISGYYETTCFKYEFKNFKFISVNMYLKNNRTVTIAKFFSKALNRSWKDISLYTTEDLKQIEHLKKIDISLKSLDKFNL